MKRIFAVKKIAFWQAVGILFLSSALVLFALPTMANGLLSVNYGNFTENGSYWPGGEVWDLTQCDLTITYTLDMSGYVPPMGNTDWSSIGVGQGAWGWMASGAPAAEQTDDNNQDLDDKLNLGAPPDRWDEATYDATGPETLVTPPIGNPWINYGIWFDRDGVDPYQADMWGMIDGATYNTGGIYVVVITYHAINSSTGTMFATVNGVQTGFYDSWKNDEPDYYPVGKSINGDLTCLQVFASLAGANVKVYNLTVTGCLLAQQGTVSGGGWFIPEANKAHGLVNLGSKATFGFIAKQKNGNASGELEFQYHGDGLNLKSSKYDWVAITPTQVIFEGTGNLNGQPNYRFRIRAVDGDKLGNGTDRFEIRIWTGAGAWEMPTYRVEGDLGGGQIMIHKQ